MQHQLLALKAIRGAPVPPFRCPCESLLRWDIEDEGDVWQEISDGEPLEGIDQALRHAGGRSLIGARRVEKAVAHDPLAFDQSLCDRVLDMVSACDGEQQRLGERAELPHAAR
jgi:hypothetical protein